MKTTFVFRIFLFCLVLFYSCSKNTSIYKELKYKHIYKAPTKGEYENTRYSKDIIPISPYDTVMMKRYSLTDTFTVLEITKEKGVYIIEIERSSPLIIYDSLGQQFIEYIPYGEIVSKQTRKVKGVEKIEVGKKYKFILNPCFVPHPIFPIKYGGSRERLYSIYLFTKGWKIPFLKSALDVYTSPDLEGLYYINSE